MSRHLFVFECSNKTYLECVEKSLFGSNSPWPLQVRLGDYCLLRHYDVGSIFALWRAESDGQPKIVPKAWGGRYPFQARVKLITPQIMQISIKLIGSYFVNSATGGWENLLQGDRADEVLSIFEQRAR